MSKSKESKRESIVVGVSSCLMGNNVRYDGILRKSSVVTDQLHFAWEVVCPEVEIGMGVPRAPIQIERRGNQERLVQPETGQDFTTQMQSFAEARLAELKKKDVAGFILKARSPSCAIRELEVVGERPTDPSNAGIFAAALMRAFPGLPLVNEEDIEDERVLEEWIQRVVAYHRDLVG